MTVTIRVELEDALAKGIQSVEQSLKQLDDPSQVDQVRAALAAVSKELTAAAEEFSRLDSTAETTALSRSLDAILKRLRALSKAASESGIETAGSFERAAANIRGQFANLVSDELLPIVDLLPADKYREAIHEFFNQRGYDIVPCVHKEPAERSST